MSNDLIHNKNSLTIEQWFNEKNQGNIDNKEIQRFKSNVLAIKNQLKLPANKTTLEACYQTTLLQLPLKKILVIVELYLLIVNIKMKKEIE